MTHASWMLLPYSKDPLDPMAMIPEGLRKKRATVKKTEEQERAETRAALMLMGECLKQGY